jgi:predicted component of type VI protein secretion system
MREEFGESRGAEGRNSAFYRHFHDMVYGGFGGEPFGLLVLDGEVDDGPADRQLLTDLSRLARACHAPLVVAAASDVSREDHRADRTHLRLTRPGHPGGRSSSWSVAAEVGRAFGYGGWFAQLEGPTVKDGNPFLHLLVAELFAKYLKCVVRDCLAGRYERVVIERGLRDWLARYTTGGEPTEQRPIRGAKVVVEPDLEDERHLVFRLEFRAAWGLTPLPDGLRVSGRIPR